jgi:transposase
VYDVQEWAEVRRLHREGWTNSAIAEKFGMSRNTVAGLVASADPPRYVRAPAGSMVDGYAEAIAAMLDEDPKVAATVILERLRPLGYRGGITILKEHVARVRPGFVAARSYQRTTYLPGELSHLDWWHTGVRVPVGRGAAREAFGFVVTLPHSMAHAATFSFGRTTADVCPAIVRCLTRLGGVPAAAVIDNDASLVASRRGKTVRLVDDVAALFGQLALRAVPLRPRFPEGKGQGERTIGYLETSFLPLRCFADLDDLQDQHDTWAATVAYERRPRRLAGTVAEAWRVERDLLAPMPEPAPVTDRQLEARVSKDGFVRTGDADYSVPPGLAGRRVQLRVSPREVVVHLEGAELARHRRSFVPADVVIDPAHVRALRSARAARRRLEDTEPVLPAVNLARYDAAVGVTR